ncbi:MFS transporter [Sandarakinorhabdus sp.]|uniref:MFS transporter n=1 Tax=Sandarakinorhabdus sp. TaxID=1916663 RepID=UPI0033422DD0
MKTARLKRIQTAALVLLVLSGLINYLDRSTLSIANSAVSGEMGLSASEMGLLLSAFSLPYAFAQLPMGALLDRLGARVTLGFGMLLWSVAQLAGGFVRTVNQFFIARLLLGVGEAPQFPAGAKVFSEWFALKERGRPTGIFVASTTIAPALAPPVLTALMFAFSWRGMFIIMGVLGILIAVAWYAIYRDRRDVPLTAEEIAYLEDGQPADDRSMTSAEWRGLFRQRTTWGLIFGFMGVIYMVWLYLTWLPAYLEKERGLPLATAGWVMIIPYLAGTLGQLSSGVLADWLLARGLQPINSRRLPLCIGLVFAALFTIPAAYTPSLTLAIACISGAMYFINLASGSSWALVSVAAPRRLVASLGSLQNFGGYLGGSLAPVITGVIVDRTGSFVYALVIAAAVALAGAVSYVFLVRDPIRDVPAPA